MGRIIAVTNNKGGVGKSTITFCLAGAFLEVGEKVLVVDMDQQGSLSSTFLENIYDLPVTVANALLEPDVPIEKVIYKTGFNNIDLIPANLELGRIEVELLTDQDSQYFLADKLDTVKDQYNYILIDCSPSLGLATRMSLIAANELIIPVECHTYAVKGTASLQSLVEKVRRRANPQLKILGYVINKYNGQRRIEQDYKKILEEKMKDRLFKTYIKNSVHYVEAITLKNPITRHLPQSEQAETYRSLMREIVNHDDAI